MARREGALPRGALYQKWMAGSYVATRYMEPVQPSLSNLLYLSHRLRALVTQTGRLKRRSRPQDSAAPATASQQPRAHSLCQEDVGLQSLAYCSCVASWESRRLRRCGVLPPRRAGSMTRRSWHTSLIVSHIPLKPLQCERHPNFAPVRLFATMASQRGFYL
jgi:hypothetical protein